MPMNRRSMLLWLAGGAVAVGLVEPVTRSIFLPPRGGWPLGRGLSSWAYSRGRQLPSELDAFDFSERLEGQFKLLGPIHYTEADVDRLAASLCKTLDRMEVEVVPVQMTYRSIWARGWSYPRITVEPVEGA